MGTTVVLRSRSSRVIGGSTVAISVAALVSAAFDGVDVLLAFGGPLALLGLLGWAGFWRPYVEVSDGGVTVVNTLRTVTVPWPAVQEVEGRYGLRLRTAYGAVTAWAASAPSGRQRARGEDSASARAVNARLGELRAAGYLDDPRLEQSELRTTWHRPVIAAAAVLVVASAVLPLFA